NGALILRAVRPGRCWSVRQRPPPNLRGERFGGERNMEMAVLGRIAVLAGALVSALPAGAIIVGGGGSKHADCLVVFDAPANYPFADPTQVRCVDGDSSCDSDGTVNGVCSVRINVCVNSTA